MANEFNIKNGFISNNNSIVQGSLIATSISAITYYNLPTDIFSGGTVSGETFFTNGVTTNTISATTYLNLPLDSAVTGFTFNLGNYDLTIFNSDNTNITQSLSILSTDMTVTGGTYDIDTGIVTFTNNSGGTFNVTGFASGYTDTFVTGGTYSDGTTVFTNNIGGTFNVTGFSTSAVNTLQQVLDNNHDLIDGKNFQGTNAGYLTTAVSNSNFFGQNAGYNAIDANESNFIGQDAGFGATNANQSNFIGGSAGYEATNANTSNFIGYFTGYQATGANRSNFIGESAGIYATDASDSNFMGYTAGEGATSAYESNFFGYEAGYYATGASNSNFIGYQAGRQATNAIYSNFMGYKAGMSFIGNNLGSNNIIIGTNISLPSGTTNSLNLGGVLFGTNTYETTTGDPSIVGQINGRIGINIVNPSEALHVAGNTLVDGNLIANTISATTYYNLPLDVKVTGLTFNPGNYDLTIFNNDNSNFTQSLSILSTDMTVTGGTYDINSGVVTFTNNSGGTFNIGGFASGYTDTYTTGATYSDGTTTFTKTNGETYSVNGYTFTGGTVSGATSYISGLTANIISATTISATTFVANSIGFRNVANTFTSNFTNTNTGSRTYTFQDRNGTIADLTDVATKMDKPSLTVNYVPKALTGGVTIGNSQIYDSGNNVQIGNIGGYEYGSNILGFMPSMATVVGIESSPNNTLGGNLTIQGGSPINSGTDVIRVVPIGTSISDAVGTTSYTIGAITYDNNNDLLLGVWFSGANGKVLKRNTLTGEISILSGFITSIYSLSVSSDNSIYVMTIGSVYKQTGGVGAFNIVPGFIGGGNNNANGLAVNRFNGDVYAFAGGVGDMYVQSGGTGDFVFLEKIEPTATGAYANGIACNPLNGDVTVFYSNSLFYFYKYTRFAGTGSFIRGTIQAAYSKLAYTNTGVLYVGNVGNKITKYSYTGLTETVVSNTGTQGAFAADAYNGITFVPTNNTKLMHISNSTGAPNLQGGTLKLNSGIGKGSGGSSIEMYTSQVLASGTTTQTATLRAKIDNTGLMTLPSVTNALITADSTNKSVITKEYLTSYTTAQLAGKMNNPSLTASYIPKALTGGVTIGDSQIRDNGINILIKNTELFPNSSYDVSLGFNSDKTIAIEDSDNSVIGRSLNINAGRAINFSKSNNFIDTNITGNSPLFAINLNDNSIYSVNGNNIIKSVENSNIFNIVGTIPTGTISDISIDYINNDVWVITAPATTGNPPNIYKQSLGSGAFVLQTFTGLSNINSNISLVGSISLFINSITKDLFYVGGTTVGGDGFIYKKSSGDTVFSLYDNTITCTSYTKIKVNTSTNDILLFYSTAGNTQYLYKQTGGLGAFNLIFSSGVTGGSVPVIFSFDVSNTNNNVYTISGGQLGNTLSIYKQTGGSGSFILQTFSGTKSVSYNYQFQTSIVIDNKGDVYGSVNNNIIYKQTNYAVGTANLQGGKLKLNSGTGKGSGDSSIEMYTGQVLASGTTMQTATLRAKIDNTGLMTLPSVTNALITADSTNKSVITKEYLTSYTTTQLAGKMNNPSLTASYIPKALTSTSIGNSRLLDTNTYLGIGTVNTPTKDITLGNQLDREIGIELSNSTTIGRNLMITAGNTINYQLNSNFLPQSQLLKAYEGIDVDSNGNVWVCEADSSAIYKQTGGIGNFIVYSTANSFPRKLTVAPNGDIYVSTWAGGSVTVRVQTGGAGAWNTVTVNSIVGSGQGDFCSAANGDVYFCTNGTGQIYMRAGGVGNFVSLAQASLSWTGLAYHFNGDVYACASGGDIYRQAGGIGNFVGLSQTSRNWSGISIAPNGNIYASVANGDIYMQTSGMGAFEQLSQTSRNWSGLAAHGNGNVYAIVYSPNSDIYIQNNAGVGTADLQGGKLKLNSGTGKGSGDSSIEMWTGQVLSAGTDMQTSTLRAKIDNTGLMTLPSVTNALIDADTTGKAAVTKEYVNNRLVVETTTGYTLTNVDSGGIVIFKTMSAQTLNIPLLLTDGFECTFVTLSGVTLTVPAVAGITLNNAIGTLLPPQSSFTLKRMIAANTFIATGNL